MFLYIIKMSFTHYLFQKYTVLLQVEILFLSHNDRRYIFEVISIWRKKTNIINTFFCNFWVVYIIMILDISKMGLKGRVWNTSFLMFNEN